PSPFFDDRMRCTIASIFRWHHGWLTAASPLYALSSVTTRQRPCIWRCSARKARLRRSRAGERAAHRPHGMVTVTACESASLQTVSVASLLRVTAVPLVTSQWTPIVALIDGVMSVGESGAPATTVPLLHFQE